MTSTADVADLNGNIFGRSICPLRFVLVALIFKKLRGGGVIPGRTRPKKARSELGQNTYTPRPLHLYVFLYLPISSNKI